MPIELTELQQKTLMQIGYGVFPRGRDGRMVDEDEEPVDGRSIRALELRGLAISSIRGVWYGRLDRCLSLTDVGRELFEEIRNAPPAGGWSWQ